MLASLMPLAFPGTLILGYAARPLFKLHFVIANVAYGLFTLAAFHAFLMLMAERRLHGFNRPAGTESASSQWLGRWLDLLPPLLTLEKLLFRLIAAGFVLLTLTIASGFLFSEQLFARAFRIDHKTVFAVISWLMFGGILIGRHFGAGAAARAALGDRIVRDPASGLCGQPLRDGSGAAPYHLIPSPRHGKNLPTAGHRAGHLVVAARSRRHAADRRETGAAAAPHGRWRRKHRTDGPVRALRRASAARRCHRMARPALLPP
jgi:hypothetical protein